MHTNRVHHLRLVVSSILISFSLAKSDKTHICRWNRWLDKFWGMFFGIKTGNFLNSIVRVKLANWMVENYRRNVNSQKTQAHSLMCNRIFSIPRHNALNRTPKFSLCLLLPFVQFSRRKTAVRQLTFVLLKETIMKDSSPTCKWSYKITSHLTNRNIGEGKIMLGALAWNWK